MLAGSPPSVVATLRQRIIGGYYSAGSRLIEIPVSEDLRVSRTPVRLAFRTLEQEGLLQRVGKRGMMVRAFSESDVRTAVEVRGVLEGLAARHLCEAGLTDPALGQLRDSIEQGRAVLARGHLTQADVGAWSALNSQFHRVIVESGPSRVIADAIGRNNHLPFASADSITIDPAALDQEYDKLRIAQLQHELIFEALRQHESARVEALMREHALVGFRYGKLTTANNGESGLK